MDKDIEQIRQIAAEAMKTATDETLSVEERAERMEKFNDEVNAINARRAEAALVADAQSRFAPLASPETPSNGPEVQGEGKSWGEVFVSSEGYLGASERGFRTGSWSVPAVEVRANVTAPETVAMDPRVHTLGTPKLTVADLIPAGVTSQNTVRALVETSATNNAASVAEGGLKPESDFVLNEVDFPVRKIATLLNVTDETLEDVSGLRSVIDQRGRSFVAQAREEQILAGTGTAPDIRGLLNLPGLSPALTATADTLADTIFQQASAIMGNSFVSPDAIVINPADWQALRLGKDANGQYLAGGPFAGAYGQPERFSGALWGIPVVESASIPQGTVLVGSFASSAMRFTRGGIVVDASNSHKDNFGNNITAIRFEERFALVVYRESAFGLVTVA